MVRSGSLGMADWSVLPGRPDGHCGDGHTVRELEPSGREGTKKEIRRRWHIDESERVSRKEFYL